MNSFGKFAASLDWDLNFGISKLALIKFFKSNFFYLTKELDGFKQVFLWIVIGVTLFHFFDLILKVIYILEK